MLRVNPKLSTNVKLIVDSNYRLFLESFDANSELAKNDFKGFRVSKESNYAYDLYNFYKNGKISQELSYNLFNASDSLSVQKFYSNQYDFFYGYGAYPKPSKLYNEEFAILAPLWIERNNIPDYFIIVRVDDPVSVSTKNIINENDPTVIAEVENPEYFIENVLNKSTIIKTVDLTENSNAGKYIRNYVYDENFPESPLSVGFKDSELTRWNGISLSEGGFSSKGNFIQNEMLVIDKTITEFENYITNGFQRNNMVVANILNFEFLFDDDIENYKFNRYFGLYVSEAELGKFVLDGNALFQDRSNEIKQVPIPQFNNVGYEWNTKDQIQTNVDGIKVYPKKVSSSIYDGTLINRNEIIDKARIAYIKDNNSNFYKIKNKGEWIDGEQLRLDNTEINWKYLTGFGDPIYSVGASSSTDIGRAIIYLTVEDNPFTGDELRILYTNPIPGPTGDGYDNTYSSTIIADSGLLASENLGKKYSNKGTEAEIAEAMTKAINYAGFEYIGAVNSGAKVIIYCRIQSENWNSIKFSVNNVNLIEFQFSLCILQ